MQVNAYQTVYLLFKFMTHEYNAEANTYIPIDVLSTRRYV